MRSQSRSTRMWGVTVVGLCVLWFAAPAEAIPLESWDNKIPNAHQRFKVLSEFGGAAVLDRETGLVWEQSPDTTTHNWPEARNTCINKPVGNRKGWRLPSTPELASLIDPTVATAGLFFPAGHPFSNIQPAGYWSETTSVISSLAWTVDFSNGVVDTSNSGALYFWCVRGGMNAPVY